jgi:SAM-dependent methyltransferase
MTSAFWNERYSKPELVYGAGPNGFLAAQAGRLPRRGRALDIGAGEGRNALFLASLGLDVLAVDQSDVGMRKTQELAKERGLSLATRAVDLSDFAAEPGSFDVVTSIFVHLPAELRGRVHAGVRSWLRPRGVYVLEAYAPDQVSRGTGGPKDPALLAPLETILAELDGLTVEHRATVVRNVTEGVFHAGDASVVQVVARKAAAS